MSVQLAQKLEVWGFEEGLLIYRDGSLGAILKLTARNTNCATSQELNTLHDATCDFLNGLPPGLSIQLVQAVDRGGAECLTRHAGVTGDDDAASPSFAKRLAQGRVKRLRLLDSQGQIPSRNLYLVVRRPFVRANPEARKPLWSRVTRMLGKRGEDGSQDWDQAILLPEIQLFHQLVRTTQNGLEALGVQSVPLQPSEIFGLLFDQWNPEHPVGPGQFNQEDIRNEVILSDLVMSVRGFSLGAVHHRVISLKIMPEVTFASMSERLKSLPFDSKLFLSFETLDQGRETFALETQRRIAYALYAGKTGVSDLGNQAKLRDIETLLSKRVSGEEKIFSASLSVVLRGADEPTLDDEVQAVLQTIRELSGAEGMLESLASAQIFLEMALPNARARERSRRMNTSVLADFLPIHGEWEGHADPKVLLRKRDGGLIGFDPFSPELPNFNQVVSGGSGVGKSFLNNVAIAHLVKDDPLIFILDIGGSYKKMTENLGGQYVALGTDSSIALNPFDLADTSDEAVDQKIKFLTSLVELMTKEEDATSIGKLERSEIEQCIMETFRGVQGAEAPRLTHLREKLLASSDVALQRMGKILGPWCGDSPFGKFIDRPTNLALEKRLICFDLKGLEAKPDLQAVCLFLITDWIWREVQRDRTRIKIVVFDECWRLLESRAGAQFIGEVFRTFRKYRASAIAISQTMNDFAQSKVASAILPNAAVKWILNQAGGNFAQLQSLLALNEREMRLIESVTSKKGYFAEAFLIAGDRRQVVAIESTPLEYWLATTDPQDLKLYQEEKIRKPELADVDLLSTLAAQFPRGAAAGGAHAPKATSQS